MTERTETPLKGVQYSETFIGECSRGCGRPATVRIHNEWVVCALHHLGFEASERANEAGLALDLMKAWRSEAKFHGCLNLVAGLDRIAGEERKRAGKAQEEFDAVERESQPDHEFRRRMGEKRCEDERSDTSEQESPKAVCSLPGCERPEAADDGHSPRCDKHRHEWDARAEVESWEHARVFLDSWATMAKEVDSPELVRVMQEALAGADDALGAAQGNLKLAEAGLRQGDEPPPTEEEGAEPEG